MIRSEENAEDKDDGHSSTGAILQRQEGYAQSSSHGGTIAFFRSKPRIAAVRTFSEGYVGGDRTPHLRETIHDGNYDHDLHTAYRLPLQRLSDQQLSMILQKHSPEVRDGDTHMSRVQMINEVQEKIVQKSTKKLMRPTLLTNINVLPEEVTIDNEPVANPKTHQRTTVASIISSTDAPTQVIPQLVKTKKGGLRRSQKNIPELETEEQNPNIQHFKSERLRKLSTKLRHVKARYDAMKTEYLQRLRQINDRKISLAIRTRPVTTTEAAPIHVETNFIDREFFEEPKKVISTVLIDNEPSNSHENVSPVKIHIVPSKTKNIITTSVHALVDNEPESAEITSTHVTPLIDNEPVESETETTTEISTTSRNDWQQTMIDKLRKIVEKAKAQQKRIYQNTETTNEDEQTTENTDVRTVSPAVAPHAYSISRQYASKVVEHKHVLPVSGLHDGGNISGEKVEEINTEQPTTEEPLPKGMVDNESHSGRSNSGFKFAMKKVGEISTSELLGQLNDELETVEESTTSAPTTTSSVATTTIEEEISTTQIVESDDEELDLFAESDEEAICDAISCDFEKGDLCEWEASQDELSPSSPHYHRRHRKAHFIRRTWHNWQGRYRNRVTGIARAQIFSFDNQRFAAAYVRPFQRATLTGKLLSGEKETIRFRGWEATRNVQLKIIFECINHGIYQGACGIDNIHLMNAYCPQVIPITGMHDNERRRKFKHL
uniref:Uncharacterized protein n=1 Tax=Panagrolaimus superbus TaxID=310955 RepID=A0A914ZCL2_9BILA